MHDCFNELKIAFQWIHSLVISLLKALSGRLLFLTALASVNRLGSAEGVFVRGGKVLFM